MAIFKAVTRRDGTALGKGKSKMKRLENYLKFETDEYGRVLPDDHGDPIPRDAIITALNGDADDFTFSCQEVFAQFNVNRSRDSLLYKHYVQGFPPEDNEKMDRETCHQLGVELARTVWTDFPVLVVSHFDQENDGIYHWHNHFIVGNCNIKNGKKLCTSSAALWAQKRFVASQADAHGLTRRGLILEDGRILEAGKRETTYEHTLARKLAAQGHELTYEQLQGQETLTQKEELRIVIREAKKNTTTFDEFRRYLSEHYDVEVKKTQNDIAYLHPDRKGNESLYGNGWIRGKSLGADFEERGPSYKRIRELNATVQKAELRLVIREAARNTDTFEGFCSYMKKHFNVEVKLTRGVISYLHPDRKTGDERHEKGWIRGRSLGTDYELEAVLNANKQFAERRIGGTATAQTGEPAAHSVGNDGGTGTGVTGSGVTRTDPERLGQLEELYRRIFADPGFAETDTRQLGGNKRELGADARHVGSKDRQLRTGGHEPDDPDARTGQGLGRDGGENNRGTRGETV